MSFILGCLNVFDCAMCAFVEVCARRSLSFSMWMNMMMVCRECVRVHMCVHFVSYRMNQWLSEWVSERLCVSVWEIAIAVVGCSRVYECVVVFCPDRYDITWIWKMRRRQHTKYSMKRVGSNAHCFHLLREKRTRCRYAKLNPSQTTSKMNFPTSNRKAFFLSLSVSLSRSFFLFSLSIKCNYWRLRAVVHCSYTFCIITIYNYSVGYFRFFFFACFYPSVCLLNRILSNLVLNLNIPKI